MTSPSPGHLIEFANQQPHPFDETRLRQSVEAILSDHGITHSEISIALVDDPTIQEYNRTYLQHDYETDVISFLLEHDHHYLSGQLIVSTDTAARLAKELNIPMNDELLLYVIHGTLHLVGLDDQTPQLAAEMRRAEKKYLEQQGISPAHNDEASIGP